MKSETSKVKQKSKHLISFVLVLFSLLTVCCPIVAYADDEQEWEEWNDDTIEQAWTVYTATDWNDLVSGLTFSITGAGSIASANVPDDFRETYESAWYSILSNCTWNLKYSASDNTKDKTEYLELMLAISYRIYYRAYEAGTTWTLEQMNGLSQAELEVIDPLGISLVVDNSFYDDLVNADNTIESSLKFIIKRYTYAEYYYIAYNEVEGASYSIYSNDEYLQAVIQGVLYGQYFGLEYPSYSTSNAEAFYKAVKNYQDDLASGENVDDVSEYITRATLPDYRFDAFANKVANNYSAIRGLSDNYVAG